MADRHVTLEGRRFIVKFNTGGQPRAVCERKLYMPGTPMEAVYDTPIYCPRKTHKNGQLHLWYRVLEKLKETLK